MGWSLDVTEKRPEKCVLCLAPHTSNWDFVVGMLYSGAEGIRSKFLMKKEWFFWPLGGAIRRAGGIPIWRDRHMSMTDHLAYKAIKAKDFCLCVTPEGTRSPNPEWKRGFYVIAMKAAIPILLYGLDYEKRKIVCRRAIIPNGDVEGQIRDIKLYYKDFKGKVPENFDIGDL